MKQQQKMSLFLSYFITNASYKTLHFTLRDIAKSAQ